MVKLIFQFGLCLFFIFSFGNENTYAQELNNPVSYAIKPQYGYIIPHSSRVEDISNTYPYGFEIEYARILLKEKNFQQCNCYSKAGVSFLFVNYANPEIVGNSYSIIGFAEPFLIKQQRFLLSTRMGIGASFLDHIYDKVDNPDNKFFSSHVAVIVHLDLNMYFKLSQNLYLMSYAKYNHISNGGLKEPNYGMNFPTFGIGLNYISENNLSFPVKEKGEFNSKYFKKIHIFGTVKRISKHDQYSEKAAVIIGISGIIGKTISKVNGFSVGVEYLNDGANKEKIMRDSLSLDHQQVSGLISHHLLFGKFDFS